jgi:hypothetical protein
MKILKENIVNNIEKIKEKLAIKYMAGRLVENDIWNLPINDELRTFICSLGSRCAYWYARYVDKSPTEETRTVACKDSECACYYALYVDKKSTDETRTAACKDPCYAFHYAYYVDNKPTDETRTAAYKNSYQEKQYQRFEKEYHAKQKKETICHTKQ